MNLGKKKKAVIEILMLVLDYTCLLYKQLALGWQLAKQAEISNWEQKI